jgi:phosphate:Na+ symporter
MVNAGRRCGQEIVVPTPMMTSLVSQPFLFALLGGLGLFLFGMKLMAEGLQRVAGARLRHILNALTVNRLLGLLVGMGMTTLVQSSTVTTVMVVGFVNAGLISLMQAIGVILGTSLGTTLTAQLMAFQVWHFGLPLIGVGAALRLFGRDRRLQDFGEIVLGAGLVFFALFLLKGACEPLRGDPELRQLLARVDDNPLLGVIVGALLTMLVQSGSASIGLTIALAGSGLLSFEAGAALILGESLGTTLTVNLSAFGSSLAARRTALAHLLFSVVGVCAMLLLFPWFTATVNALTPGEPEFVIHSAEHLEIFAGSLGDKPYIARHIANAHTLLHLSTALLFLPLVGQLARLTARLIPGRDEPRDFHLNYLDPRVMNTPPIALAQARAEVRRMAELTGEVVAETVLLIGDQRRERVAAMQGKEELIDRLQREITDFLVTLTQQSVTAETSREVAALIHMVNDLERVGDHCAALGQLVERKLDQQIEFSAIARRELAEMSRLVVEFHELVAAALKQEAVTLSAARYLEDAIDRSEELLRNNHIRRLNTGECTVVSGLVFIDMLHHLEKIGDHCFNVIRSFCELEVATSGVGQKSEVDGYKAS